MNKYSKIGAAKKAGKMFITKHPILAVGAGSTVIGAMDAYAPRGPIKKLEGKIMREYMRGLNSKYAEDVRMCGAIHSAITARSLFYKKAANFDAGYIAGESAIREGTKAGWGLGFEGIRRLVGGVTAAIRRKKHDEPIRHDIEQTLLREDPIIRSYEHQYPGMTHKAIDTMAHVAPTLSTNPLVVQSFVRNVAMSGGPIDHQTIKGLADAEKSVVEARNVADWSGHRY
jgi:hypothetical protein